MYFFKILSSVRILMVGVFILLIACKSERHGEQPDATRSVESLDTAAIEAEISLYLVTTVDNIRIRSAAGLNQNVLFTLPKSSRLLYVNDSTKQLEKISMNGVSMERPWYKVKYEKLDSIGWVYGGGVRWEVDPLQAGKPPLELLPSRLISKVKDGLAANLSQVLQVDIPGQHGLYNGYYEYRLNTNNERVLDGVVRLETHLQSEGYNRMAVEGQYSLGVKDGLFIYTFYGQNIEYQVGIYFDKTSGECQHGYITGSIHDDLIDLKDIKMSQCTILSLMNSAGITVPKFL